MIPTESLVAGRSDGGAFVGQILVRVVVVHVPWNDDADGQVAFVGRCIRQVIRGAADARGRVGDQHFGTLLQATLLLLNAVRQIDFEQGAPDQKHCDAAGHHAIKVSKLS